jgi:hypothetical protein
MVCEGAGSYQAAGEKARDLLESFIGKKIDLPKE